MTYSEFVEVVVRDAREAVVEDYSKPEDKHRLDGSLWGLEECVGKTPAQLVVLLDDAVRVSLEKGRDEAEDYWFWRCREAEIEWVCDVLGAGVGFVIGRAVVTARGILKAAEVKAKGDGYLAV